MSRLALRSARCLVVTTAAFVVAGCNSTDVVAPPAVEEGTFTVDARSQWQYVSLIDSALVTPGGGLSPNWDVAFFGTNVTLNGGAAGPGGVVGACICQNAGASNEEVLAMTAESEKADFESVTSVPEGITWSDDVLTPAIAGWHTGQGASAVADPSKTYLVRLNDSTGYAKVRVIDIENPTATAAGTITLEYAVQSSPTAQLGAVQTKEVQLTSTGTSLVDLNPADGVPIGTGWDLSFQGFSIKVNGGVSGAGKGAATLATTPWTETTTAKTADQAYKIDNYAGIFGTNRFYRYNILGDHRISPTYDVYLVKRGSAVYKLQITGYYNATNTARYVSFRYAKIAG